MAQITTSNYKHYVKADRQLTSENGFELGMRYTGAPLDGGHVKTLVNYDIIEQGTKLRPRAGLKSRQLLSLGAFASEAAMPDVLWSGELAIKNGDDATMRRACICAAADPTVADLILVIEDAEGTFKKSTLTGSYSGRYVATTAFQAMDMHDIEMPNTRRRLNATVVDNTMYIQTYTETGGVRTYQLWKLIPTGTTSFSHSLEHLVPREVTPTEAVNYGYNMLDTSPYDFPNQAVGFFKLEGILPYDASGTLKLQAQVGEKLTFRLIYSYNSSETRKVKVQWEFNDLTTSKAPHVARALSKSPLYAMGDAITLAVEPPYKAFSLTAKVYFEDDLTEPTDTMILASYYMTKDKKDDDKAFKAQTFPLVKAGQMGTWGNRAVAWDVPGARSTVFVSDVSDPSYFPFPHMAIPCFENVLRCVPFLSDMLIFTTTKILQAKLDTEGNIVTSIIQDNLDFKGWDAETIIPVRNMVFFKTNNYYYMIVPVLNVRGVTELKMAPISTPIEPLLDRFNQSVKEIFQELHPIEFAQMTPQGDWTIAYKGFQNWIDNTTIYNSYLVELASVQQGKTIRAEFNLKYDTMLRAWTIDIVEVSQRPRAIFRRKVTALSQYLIPIYNAGTCWLQLLEGDQQSASDTFDLSNDVERYLKNWQLLDTGKRNHAVTHKKRYRELQFLIHNVAQQDIPFRDAFVLDDDVREDLFTYAIRHITDRNDPDYGTIYVERIPAEHSYIPGVTKLDSWMLDVSMFPDVTLVKTRVEVSGKGYAGRWKFVGMAEAMYEMLQISWAYRLMNAR